ncbi:hypothetical protein QE370_000880 [Aeromicrobium sp. SORGH_AS981]|uniref:PH domain-containing protein n=1 Tax=Aeromicrobium sp. SORGH_AS_0981 TaxID=3041802 RepID=UPI002864F8D0|nr:PH domain-containing protein [Aeromicrobium sp. SORGH_AS_0981]MDR6117696.1 hypothetical protein [Aeromicrobium sp. SORGH_AS_0981]
MEWRTFGRWRWLVIVTLGVVMSLFCTVVAASGGWSVALVVTPMTAALLWVIWWPKASLDEATVVIRTWRRTVRLPVEDLARIESTYEGARFTTVDGRSVTASALQKGNLSLMLRLDTATDRAVRAIRDVAAGRGREVILEGYVDSPEP